MTETNYDNTRMTHYEKKKLNQKQIEQLRNSRRIKRLMGMDK